MPQTKGGLFLSRGDRTVSGRFKEYRRRDKSLRNRYGSYKSYLQSAKWRSIRSAILKRDGGLCVACGAAAENVHHTSYTKRCLRAGHKSLALVSLCRPCHMHIEFDDDGVKVSVGVAGQRLRDLCRANGKTLPGRCPICLLVPLGQRTMCRKCEATATETKQRFDRPNDAPGIAGQEAMIPMMSTS